MDRVPLPLMLPADIPVMAFVLATILLGVLFLYALQVFINRCIYNWVRAYQDALFDSNLAHMKKISNDSKVITDFTKNQKLIEQMNQNNKEE